MGSRRHDRLSTNHDLAFLLTNNRNCRAIYDTCLPVRDTDSPINQLGGRDMGKRAVYEVDGKELAGIALPKGGVKPQMSREPKSVKT